jgi:hypothetical protein
MELLKIHEDKGAVIARRILENVNYPPDRIASIIAIVLGHDSRRQPLDINDKIVKDADQLSRFSPYLWFMLDRVGMTAPEICDALETRIPSWFHLPLSLQLAQRELALRRQEIAEQSN